MEKARLREAVYGLPVLTIAEHDELLDLTFESKDHETGHPNTYIYDIADVAIYARPAIDRIIDLDVEQLTQEPELIQQDPGGREQYIRGITLGYRFIVGCMTYVSYRRDPQGRDHTDINDYVYSLPSYAQTLPLAFETQIERVSDCFRGEVMVNRRHHIVMPGSRSPCIAENYREFIKASPLFSSVIGLEQDRVEMGKFEPPTQGIGSGTESASEDRLTNRHLYNGYITGLEGGVALYMQSHQQMVIAYAELDILS